MSENNKVWETLKDSIKPTENPAYAMNLNKANNNFDNIMDLLKPNETETDEIKEAIKKLQEEVAQLKKENQDLKENGKENKEPLLNEKHSEIIDAVGKYASQEMDKGLSENGVKAMAICISKSIVYNGSGATVSAACVDSFNESSEEGISAAVEVFANPRRIAILKVLIEENGSLTATEITQKTGLVGGQLYHHLNNLENAGLIIKENEKYKADGSTHGLLIRLYAVLGGMKLARE